jgi:hypothetical protein
MKTINQLILYKTSLNINLTIYRYDILKKSKKVNHGTASISEKKQDS